MSDNETFSLDVNLNGGEQDVLTVEASHFSELGDVFLAFEGTTHGWIGRDEAVALGLGLLIAAGFDPEEDGDLSGDRYAASGMRMLARHLQDAALKREMEEDEAEAKAIYEAADPSYADRRPWNTLDNGAKHVWVRAARVAKEIYGGVE